MNIDFTFEQLIQTRKNIAKILLANQNYASLIPEGFNNSLLWNAAHCVAAQQGLCYSLSGLDKNVSDEFIASFKKGSSPSDISKLISVPELIEILNSTAEKIKIDYYAGKFTQYSKYETSYGTILNSSEEAILFNNVHEALHLGYMMSMVKSLPKT